MSGIVRGEDKKERRRVPLRGKVRGADNCDGKSLLKLKQQEYSMEKSLASLMENVKLAPEVLRAVLHDMGDVARNRQTLLESARAALQEIVEQVRSVRSVVDCPSADIRNLDTDAYKQRLLRLSQRIRDFKESCRLRALSQEQAALESELREFQSNLHKYEKSATGSGKLPTTSAASSSMENKRRHDYKEIQDLHALIAKTGRTDNWSDEDHLLFLKMRKKCGNIPALVAAVQTKCPDLTAETIVNHEAWYKVYLDLREKQRSIVREWRKRKETEKTNKIREEQIDISEAAPLRKEANVAETVSHVTDNCKKSTKKTENAMGDRANREKELIRQWRTEKENKRWMDEERSRILAESKLAAQEKRRRERSKSIKETLAEYREKKLMESSSRVSKTVSRPKYNPVLITAFRKQDEEYTNKRRNLIERLARPAKSRTTRIVRSQVAKKRDYSTLMNSTKVWTERCKMQAHHTKGPVKRLQYIKDVPRLYVQRRNQESMEVKNVLGFF